MITCSKVCRDTVYLLTIFDKSDQENIADKDLKELLKLIDWPGFKKSGIYLMLMKRNADGRM